MKPQLRCLSLVLCFAWGMPFPARAAIPPLIPHPASVRETGGAMELPTPLTAHIPEEFKAIAPAFNSPVCGPLSWETARTAALVFERAEGMAPEAYTLNAGGGKVIIRASDPAGWRHGWQTFLQLTERAGPALRLPHVAIEDAPRFRWRGLMLDSSRHIQSVDAILRLLDQMAMLKLNRFHWHLTDNNGWRIEIPSHPRLTTAGGFVARGLEPERNGFYTQADIRRVCDHARALGIEVVPEIDLPGHAAAIADAYPEFLCPTNRERPPVSRRGHNTGYHEIICLAHEPFYDFIRTVFKETRDATGCVRIHIGGDEVEFGTWSRCPRCSARMKELGIRDEKDYQNHFLSRLGDIVRELGMESIYWVESTDRPLPRVTVAHSWRTYGNQLKESLARGLPAIESSGKYAYLDYPAFPNSPKSKWMPVLSLEQVYTHAIVPPDVPADQTRRILGGEAALWTEEILEKDIDGMLYPRVLAVAEQLWSPDAVRRWPDFQARLARLQPVLEQRGIRFGREYARDQVRANPPGARVETSAGFSRANWPEYVSDGNTATAYIAERPGRTGDTVSVHLASPLSTARLAVITGGFFVHDEREGAVRNGWLELTEDGTTWESVARLDELGQADVRFAAPRTIRGARIRVGANMSGRIVVNEFLLK